MGRFFGIISTYVENTTVGERLLMLKRDHLHLRGEYSLISTPILAPPGSSPLTWRILHYRKSLNRQLWDHLHLRGEYRPSE